MSKNDASGSDPAAEEVLLVDRMRTATKKAHTVSDAMVNSKLVVAFTDPKLYGAALSSFWPVFQAIEENLDKHREHADIKPLITVLDAMKRTKRLEADIDYFLGEKWQSRYRTPHAVSKYIEHLDALEAEDPALLLVFSYHMHMAVCAGGAMIKKMARKAMKLPKDKGTEVFEFQLDEGVFLNSLKSDYKAGINNLGASKGEDFSRRVEEESLLLFKLNNTVVSNFQAGFLGYIRAVSMLCPKPISAGLAAAGATALLAFAAFGVAQLRQHTSAMPSFFGPTALLTLAAALLIYRLYASSEPAHRVSAD